VIKITYLLQITIAKQEREEEVKRREQLIKEIL
jgi:hypothetical protein